MVRYRQPRTTCGVGPEYILVPKSGSNSIKQAMQLTQQRRGREAGQRFVFSFVRHPLARLVSAYVEKVQTGKTKVICPRYWREIPPEISLSDFVVWLNDFEQGRPYVLNDHFCPQSWLLRDEKDLEFVGCLERAKEDWKVLMSRGVEELPHRHKTVKIKPWYEMLDGQTERQAREFYIDDFNTWGKDFRWE